MEINGIRVFVDWLVIPIPLDTGPELFEKLTSYRLIASGLHFPSAGSQRTAMQWYFALFGPTFVIVKSSPWLLNNFAKDERCASGPQTTRGRRSREFGSSNGLEVDNSVPVHPCMGSQGETVAFLPWGIRARMPSPRL